MKLVQEVVLELFGVVHQAELDVDCLMLSEVRRKVERMAADRASRLSEVNKDPRPLICHVVFLDKLSGCRVGKWHPDRGELILEDSLDPALRCEIG